MCFIGYYPPECQAQVPELPSSDSPVENTTSVLEASNTTTTAYSIPPCERGYGELNTFYYSSILFRYGLLFTFCSIIISSVWIIVNLCCLQKQQSSTHQYHRRGSNEMAIEGMGYMAIYFLVFTPVITMALTDPYPHYVGTNGDDNNNDNSNAYFAMALVTKCLSPMAGFLNTLVFLFWSKRRGSK